MQKASLAQGFRRRETPLTAAFGGWTGTVWSGAGSGCSAFNAALSAAASSDTGCTKRAMADVSAVADPNTGVAVYDSTKNQGSSGWMVFGGTSASAPIVASVYVLSGSTAGYANAIPYSHTSSLFDVTSGSNGSCVRTQCCNARPVGMARPAAALPADQLRSDSVN